MNRRKSRETAMKLLYEMSINKENSKDKIESFKENSDTKLEDIDLDYLEKTLVGVEDNITVINAEIEKRLINWKIDRISKINMAILRICTYEIMFESDIPYTVSINEGIELAKKYSEDKSASFINGVLGKMLDLKISKDKIE
jgi:transcription antitermination protein NusB